MLLFLEGKSLMVLYVLSWPPEPPQACVCWEIEQRLSQPTLCFAPSLPAPGLGMAAPCRGKSLVDL